MLNTETNNPKMAKRVEKAFRKFLRKRAPRIQVDFEHGQWFASCLDCGATWSVVDAEPGIDGFDFEELSGGDGYHAH